MAGRPDLGNSRVEFLEPVTKTDHVTASMWCNIEDPELSARLHDYWEAGGAQPNLVLQRKSGDYRIAVSRIRLFFNTNKDKSAGGDNGGFDR